MALNLKEFLAGVKVKDILISENITIYPLIYEKDLTEPVPYYLLEEALKTGEFEIGEISEAGNVNTIIVTNMLGQPVLILDGEELLGAKQNRMVNATVMIPAEQKVEIPVSCVERGRWRYSSEKFDRPGAFGYSTLRRQKTEQVAYSLQFQRQFKTDQGAIWEEIDRKQASMGSHSATDAMNDVYGNLEEEINKLVEKLKPVDSQCGHLVYINNRFACLDLFDKPETLTKLWLKLIKSYAVEAIEARRKKTAEGNTDPALVIEKIADSDCIAYPSVGLGRDLRLTGKGIIGAGLALDDRIVHLSVFPKDTASQDTNNISTPRRRRRTLY